jgi:rhamnogalacturonyl hydrolase YesR
MHAHPTNELFKVSRRAFLQTGVTTAIAGSSLSGWAKATDVQPTSFYANPDFLSAAVETARWVRTAERKSYHGIYWLPEPDHPEKLTKVSPFNGIYSGSAGTVLFFLQLAKATNDKSYLDDATRGADFLAATWQELLTGKEHIPGTNLSFYNGLSGLAFVLAETWQATGDPRYKEAALASRSTLQMRRSQQEPVSHGLPPRESSVTEASLSTCFMQQDFLSETHTGLWQSAVASIFWKSQ